MIISFYNLSIIYKDILQIFGIFIENTTFEEFVEICE